MYIPNSETALTGLLKQYFIDPNLCWSYFSYINNESTASALYYNPGDYCWLPFIYAHKPISWSTTDNTDNIQYVIQRPTKI